MCHMQQLVANFFWSLVVFILTKLLRYGSMIGNDIPQNLISEQNIAIKIINNNKFGCDSFLARTPNRIFFA